MSGTLMIAALLVAAVLLGFSVLFVRALWSQQRRYLTWYQVERRGEDQLAPPTAEESNAA